MLIADLSQHAFYKKQGNCRFIKKDSMPGVFNVAYNKLAVMQTARFDFLCFLSSAYAIS